MGLGEIAQLAMQTILQLKVDNTDLKQKLKEVGEAEKAAVRDTIASNDARNKSIDEWVGRLTKVNVAIAGVTKVVELGRQAWSAFEEHQRLTAASGDASLGRLRAASHGLRNDMDLLRLAAVANQATFKLSEDQLDNAARAMIAFERAGVQGAKATEKVREAILKGNIEPLKELGVNLDAAQGKGAQFAQLMQVLGEKAAGAGSATATSSEDFKRAGVEWDNAMNKMQVAIGGLVAALAPLLSALAKAVGLIADVVDAAGGALGAIHEGMSLTAKTDKIIKNLPNYIDAEIQAAIAGEESRRAAAREEAASRWDAMINADPNAGWTQRAGARLRWASRNAPKKGPRGTGGDFDILENGGVDTQDVGIDVEREPLYRGEREVRRGADWAGRPIGFSTDVGRGVSDRVAPAIVDLSEGVAGLSKMAEQFRHVGTQSLLEQVLGPIDQFDAYAEGFGVLSGTLQAGFDAWVSGSASAGEAMKKFFASAISGVASNMFAKSLEHGAYALGSLAFGDMIGAKKHGIAAAAFGAGSVVVGALARTVNTSMAAPAASAGAGGGAGAGAGSGSGGGGGTHVTVVISDSSGDESPRARAAATARAYRRAQRELDDGNGVSYS